jgi:alkylation response protein AidB-like acyl-CoA dehydrogenase
MDFSIPEELKNVQDLAAQILADFTEVEQLRRLEQQQEPFDDALWQALAGAGLLGVDIEEVHGGMGIGFGALTALCEEVGRTVAAVPVVPVLVSAAATLRRFATSQQKERFLPGVADGSTLLSAALEEYNNDNPARPSCAAEALDGGFSLNGTKICISQAKRASRILVSATTGEELVVALVDPDAAGVTLSPQVVTSGETRHELRLERVQVPTEDIIAVGGKALQAMDWALQATRTALSAMAVGLCDKMMRITGQYTSEREQFGRAIATFQAVSHRVADCYIDVECLRLVTQQATSLLDQGRPAGEASTIAKIWCGDVTHRVSQSAQHCHGGTGVDRDYPLHRYCLWARQIELSAGNTAQLTAQLGRTIGASFRAAG